jgi:hypothetical protein
VTATATPACCPLQQASLPDVVAVRCARRAVSSSSFFPARETSRHSIGSKTCRPLPSTGSLDSVPPIHRYYKAIRPPIRVPPCSPSPASSAPFGLPRTAVPLLDVLAVCILDMIEFPRASRAAHTGRAFAGGLPVQRGRKGSPRFLGSLYARVPVVLSCCAFRASAHARQPWPSALRDGVGRFTGR